MIKNSRMGSSRMYWLSVKVPVSERTNKHFKKVQHPTKNICTDYSVYESMSNETTYAKNSDEYLFISTVVITDSPVMTSKAAIEADVKEKLNSQDMQKHNGTSRLPNVAENWKTKWDLTWDEHLSIW